jgi:glycosyltransferase involved in cell wall biosynthesis
VQGAQNIENPERGIARYVAALANALGEVSPGVVTGYVIDPTLPVPAPVARLSKHAPLIAFDDPELAQADVYHVASPFEPRRAAKALLPLAVRAGRPRLVATMYDLIPLLMADDYLPTGIEKANYRRGLELVRCCDKIVAISQSTATDTERLLELDGSRIRVIGAGADDDRFRPGARSVDPLSAVLVGAVPGLRSRYLLVPTGMDARKNWRGALRAYAGLPTSVRALHQIVVACRVDDQQRAEVLAEAHSIGIGHQIVLTGVVDDRVLVALYQQAHLVLFPSRYEGFGLPVLEARLCGAPVICGDNSSLREVITEPRARFDADDPADIVRVLRPALGDPAFRRMLGEIPIPPHSWTTAARVVVDTYEELAALPHTSARAVGVVDLTGGSSLIGASGIGSSSAHLVRFGQGARPIDSIGAHLAAGLLSRLVYVTAPDTTPGTVADLVSAFPGDVLPAADAAGYLSGLPDDR